MNNQPVDHQSDETRLSDELWMRLEMNKKETAIVALENLASNIDTTATTMRKLGNPYRIKSLELSVTYEMVIDWINDIKKLSKRFY